MKQPILDALQQVVRRGRSRFHFPSHGGKNLYKSKSTQSLKSIFPEELLALDNTELPELDVLGNPKGVILESQEQAAFHYGTEKTFYLINGASVGLMAALLALPKKETPHKVLAARNCHRSVVHGLILSGAEPIWILPEALNDWGLWGEIKLENIKQAFEKNTDCTALIITHPTYEGTSSKITEITNWCKENNILLIVDEAHGALWPLSKELPTSAIQTQADCVIHSLHKSAGALTQTALLHLPQNSKFNAERIQQSLNILQTTSPSYLMLANIEETLSFWFSEEGKAYLKNHLQRCNALSLWIAENCPQLSQLHSAPMNQFQLVLKCDRLPPEALGELLEETYGIAYEASYEKAALLHLHPTLDDNDFEKLKDALLKIDQYAETLTEIYPLPKLTLALPQQNQTPQQAFFKPNPNNTADKIIAPYPPGIPSVIPGEISTDL